MQTQRNKSESAPESEGEGVVRSSAVLGALVLKTEKGLIAIRKDAVVSVECATYGGRNLACIVNGIETQSGYDFVLSALGWRLHECA